MIRLLDTQDQLAIGVMMDCQGKILLVKGGPLEMSDAIQAKVMGLL